MSLVDAELIRPIRAANKIKIRKLQNVDYAVLNIPFQHWRKLGNKDYVKLYVEKRVKCIYLVPAQTDENAFKVSSTNRQVRIKDPFIILGVKKFPLYADVSIEDNHHIVLKY